jgi:hypothetical protein
MSLFRTGELMAALSTEEVEFLLLSAIADELEVTEDELQQQLDDDGDFVVGSQAALSVIAALEGVLERRLAGVEELQPEEVTTFQALLRTLVKQTRGSD